MQGSGLAGCLWLHLDFVPSRPQTPLESCWPPWSSPSSCLALLGLRPHPCRRRVRLAGRLIQDAIPSLGGLPGGTGADPPKSGSVCRREMGILLAPSATDFRPQGGPPSTLHQAICRFSQAHFLEARLKWSSQDLKLCPGGMPDPQAAALLAVQGCLDLAWARVLGTPEMQRPPEVNVCMGAGVGAPPRWGRAAGSLPFF